MAAADGTVVPGPARPDPLFGLTSVLLLRESRADLGRGGPEEGAVIRWGRRAGEVSRDDMGEPAVDGEPDTFSERTPLSVWCRVGTGPLSEEDAAADTGALLTGSLGVAAAAAETEADGVVVVAVVAVVVVVVDAGSAVSGEPLSERKDSSRSVVMMAMAITVYRAWGRRAAVACWFAGEAMSWWAALWEQRGPVVEVDRPQAHAHRHTGNGRSSGQFQTSWGPFSTRRTAVGCGRPDDEERGAVAQGRAAHLLAAGVDGVDGTGLAMERRRMGGEGRVQLACACARMACDEK